MRLPTSLFLVVLRFSLCIFVTSVPSVSLFL